MYLFTEAPSDAINLPATEAITAGPNAAVCSVLLQQHYQM